MSGVYKLIGRIGSGSSACEAVLAMSGLPYETEDLERWPDRQPPVALTALNPLGQVPVLILPDGSVMTESAAIVMHVAALTNGAKLAPEPGTSEHALYLRLMLFLAANVYMTDLSWFYPHRLSTDPADAPRIKAQSGIDQRKNWATLEGIAASGNALLPSGFSAADIYLAMLVSWTELDDFNQAYPRIASIARSVAEVPAIGPVWRRHGIA
jgi:glutathione S-transferase